MNNNSEELGSVLTKASHRPGIHSSLRTEVNSFQEKRIKGGESPLLGMNNIHWIYALMTRQLSGWVPRSTRKKQNVSKKNKSTKKTWSSQKSTKSGHFWGWMHWREQRVGSYPGDRSNGVSQMLVSAAAPQPFCQQTIWGNTHKRNHDLATNCVNLEIMKAKISKPL